MRDSARLTQLILDQIDGDKTTQTDDAEFIRLLETALADGGSRLDLRDRLMAGARDSNAVTRADVDGDGAGVAHPILAVHGLGMERAGAEHGGEQCL